MSSSATTTPLLEEGQRLTREEFEHRYEAMPDLKKAELIEGVVHVPSPVRLGHHGTPHAALMLWLGTYWLNTPGVRAADNTTIRLDADNEPQPDGLLMIEPAHGGQAHADAQDYVAGAPELVAEVAASHVALDLGIRKTAYERNKVREYLVWRVPDAAIDWFILRGSQYERCPRQPATIAAKYFQGCGWTRPHWPRSTCLRWSASCRRASPARARGFYRPVTAESRRPAVKTAARDFFTNSSSILSRQNRHGVVSSFGP